MNTPEPMSCCLRDIDPYSIQAGPELDVLIHHRVLGKASAEVCPSYSTDRTAADKLKKTIEADYRTTIVTGRTELRSQLWFARYEIDPGNPTEVLAETYALAICRLVLLRVRERR